MNGPSQKPLRVQKVEKELHQCIGKAVTELLFIDQGVLVTVVEVDVAADMRSARVFVSVFPDHYADEVFHELNVIRADVQKQIGKAIRMKFMPKISWHKDKSVNEIDRIGKIFSEESQKNRSEDISEEEE